MSESLSVPTIGIGAGPHCGGQVLVYHDLLGMMHHPHHEKHVPSFCKRYATIGKAIHEVLLQFKEEVHGELFPTEQYAPYKMPPEEHNKFVQLMAIDETERQTEGKTIAQKLREADEYETINLY